MLESLPSSLSDIEEDELLKWINEELANERGVFAKGYQGKVLLFMHRNERLVIKAPPSKGLLGGFYKSMVRHEYEIYRRLKTLDGVPKCYGLLDNQYLVLSFIDGGSLREREPEDRALFFNRLLKLLHDMHSLGVAHFDLKRKDNILVADNDVPYLIDFGLAVTKKPRPYIHLLNRYLFSQARRFDFNAWVKHKYKKDYRQVSDEDRRYLDRSLTETVSHTVKVIYRYFKKKKWRLER